jgi:DNA polymerase III gamma/tau subunit
MPDVFDGLVGQHRAVNAMRQFAKSPVHAYIITGPVGSSLHDAALAFAAALQCRDNGCGFCESCRLVMSENDPDVYFAERAACRGALTNCERLSALVDVDHSARAIRSLS